MPNSGVRPGEPRDPKLKPIYSQKDLDDAIRVAKLEQATHDVKGVQQHRLAAEVLTAKAAPPTQQRMTMFQTVVSILVGTVGLGMVAIGGINAYATSQAQVRESTARIASLESWRTEMVAMNLPAEIRDLKNLSRTRDLQYQAMNDQITQLRQADSAAGLQNQELLRNNTALQTRMEDIIRQLAEIKSQLNRGAFFPSPTQRGDSEAPAHWYAPRPSQT
jgi:DNA repair exonuclease SbcCD ATPase subunit